MPIVVRHSPSIASIAEIARQGGRAEFLKWKTQFRQSQKNAQAQGIGSMLTLGLGFAQPFMLNAQRQKYQVANQAAAAGQAMQQSQADAGAMGHLLTGDNTPFKNADGTPIFNAQQLAAMSPQTRSGLLRSASNFLMQDAGAQLQYNPERIATQMLAQQDGQNLALEKRETDLSRNLNDWMDLANHGIIGFNEQTKKFSDPAIQKQFERSVRQVGNMRAKDLPLSAQKQRELIPMQNGMHLGKDKNNKWYTVDTNGPQPSAGSIPKLPTVQYGEQPEWKPNQVIEYWSKTQKYENDIANDYVMTPDQFANYMNRRDALNDDANQLLRLHDAAEGPAKAALMEQWNAKTAERDAVRPPSPPSRTERRQMAMEQIYWEQGGLAPPNHPQWVPPSNRAGGRPGGPMRPLGDRTFDPGEGVDPGAAAAPEGVLPRSATQLGRGTNMFAAGPGRAENAWRTSLAGDRQTANALSRMMNDPQGSVAFAKAAKDGLTLGQAMERDPGMLEAFMDDKERKQFRLVTEGARLKTLGGDLAPTESGRLEGLTVPGSPVARQEERVQKMTALIGQERMLAARVALSAHYWSPPGEVSLANIPAPTTDQLRDLIQAGHIKAGDVLIDPVAGRKGFVVIPQTVIDQLTGPKSDREQEALLEGYTGNALEPLNYARGARTSGWPAPGSAGAIDPQSPPPPMMPRTYQGEAYPPSPDVTESMKQFERSLPTQGDIAGPGTFGGEKIYKLPAVIRARREAAKFLRMIPMKMKEQGYGDEPREWPARVRDLYYEAERWQKLQGRGRMQPRRSPLPRPKRNEGF